MSGDDTIERVERVLQEFLAQYAVMPSGAEALARTLLDRAQNAGKDMTLVMQRTTMLEEGVVAAAYLLAYLDVAVERAAECPGCGQQHLTNEQANEMLDTIRPMFAAAFREHLVDTRRDHTETRH